MRRKKGSISLSINMIVVVVLAFVMLGLMLTLGRNIVTSAGQSAEQISEQTRQDIINKLSQSNEPLYFTQRQFDIGFGKSTTLMFGIKNTYPSQKDLKVNIYFIDPKTGNREPIDPTEPYDYGKFQWDIGEQRLRAGEGKPFDVKYFAPSTVDTYQFKFEVVDVTDGQNNFVAEQSIFIEVV